MSPVSLATTAPLPLTGPNGSLSLFEYVRAGGPLGYVLLGLSVLACALTLRNLYVLRVGHLVPSAVAVTLGRLLREGDIEGARGYCRERKARSFITSVVSTAIERCLRSAPDSLNVRTAVEDVGANAIAGLHRMNNSIGIIAAIGPMLGLLGTVIGMIGAFHSIGALEGAARSTELARFMSLALVNTAEGLIVAIPCTVVYSLFRQRIDRMAGEVGELLESMASDLDAALAARGFGPDRGARPAPVARTAAVP